jgi:ribosome assembly protein 1
VSLEVSPPLVSYRETIEGEASNMLDNLKSSTRSSDYVEKMTPNGRCVVRVQVMKLPSALTTVLDKSTDLLGDIIGGKLGQSASNLETEKSNIVQDESPIEVLKKRIMGAVESDILSLSKKDKDRAEKYKLKWQKFLKRIWALGPRQVGPNILFTPDSKSLSNDSSALVRGSPHVSERLGLVECSGNGEMPADTSSEELSALYREAESLQNSVVSGFQLATAAGLICDEPMWGLAFVIEVCICPLAEQSESNQQSEQYAIFARQVMTAVKDACRAAVLQKKPWLVEAAYFCELTTPTEYLGSMYAVLNRKRARVSKEEMQDGSPLFTVHAYIPVSESFGFDEDLRRSTAGAASALLVLFHWEALSEDPFFVPKTGGD